MQTKNNNSDNFKGAIDLLSDLQRQIERGSSININSNEYDDYDVDLETCTCLNERSFEEIQSEVSTAIISHQKSSSKTMANVFSNISKVIQDGIKQLQKEQNINDVNKATTVHDKNKNKNDDDNIVIEDYPQEQLNEQHKLLDGNIMKSLNSFEESQKKFGLLFFEQEPVFRQKYNQLYGNLDFQWQQTKQDWLELILSIHKYFFSQLENHQMKFHFMRTFEFLISSLMRSFKQDDCQYLQKWLQVLPRNLITFLFNYGYEIIYKYHQVYLGYSNFLIFNKFDLISEIQNQSYSQQLLEPVTTNQNSNINNSTPTPTHNTLTPNSDLISEKPFDLIPGKAKYQAIIQESLKRKSNCGAYLLRQVLTLIQNKFIHTKEFQNYKRTIETISKHQYAKTLIPWYGQEHDYEMTQKKVVSRFSDYYQMTYIKPFTGSVRSQKLTYSELEEDFYNLREKQLFGVYEKIEQIYNKIEGLSKELFELQPDLLDNSYSFENDKEEEEEEIESKKEANEDEDENQNSQESIHEQSEKEEEHEEEESFSEQIDFGFGFEKIQNKKSKLYQNQSQQLHQELNESLNQNQLNEQDQEQEQELLNESELGDSKKENECNNSFDQMELEDSNQNEMNVDDKEEAENEEIEMEDEDNDDQESQEMDEESQEIKMDTEKLKRIIEIKQQINYCYDQIETIWSCEKNSPYKLFPLTLKTNSTSFQSFKKTSLNQKPQQSLSYIQQVVLDKLVNSLIDQFQLVCVNGIIIQKQQTEYVDLSLVQMKLHYLPMINLPKLIKSISHNKTKGKASKNKKKLGNIIQSEEQRLQNIQREREEKVMSYILKEQKERQKVWKKNQYSYNLLLTFVYRFFYFDIHLSHLLDNYGPFKYINIFLPQLMKDYLFNDKQILYEYNLILKAYKNYIKLDPIKQSMFISKAGQLYESMVQANENQVYPNYQQSIDRALNNYQLNQREQKEKLQYELQEQAKLNLSQKDIAVLKEFQLVENDLINNQQPLLVQFKKFIQSSLQNIFVNGQSLLQNNEQSKQEIKELFNTLNQCYYKYGVGYKIFSKQLNRYKQFRKKLCELNRLEREFNGVDFKLNQINDEHQDHLDQYLDQIISCSNNSNHSNQNPSNLNSNSNQNQSLLNSNLQNNPLNSDSENNLLIPTYQNQSESLNQNQSSSIQNTPSINQLQFPMTTFAPDKIQNQTLTNQICDQKQNQMNQNARVPRKKINHKIKRNLKKERVNLLMRIYKLDNLMEDLFIPNLAQGYQKPFNFSPSKPNFLEHILKNYQNKESDLDDGDKKFQTLTDEQIEKEINHVNESILFLKTTLKICVEELKELKIIEKEYSIKENNLDEDSKPILTREQQVQQMMGRFDINEYFKQKSLNYSLQYQEILQQIEEKVLQIQNDEKKLEEEVTVLRSLNGLYVKRLRNSHHFKTRFQAKIDHISFQKSIQTMHTLQEFDKSKNLQPRSRVASLQDIIKTFA